jgi:hypothetical protein
LRVAAKMPTHHSIDKLERTAEPSLPR